MAYSCAYWARPDDADYTLQDAQRDKLELICRKLGLSPGMRLLDVGCGWGSLAIHAAQQHGVEAVGITLSHEQAEYARKRVAEAGLSDRVEIRVQDCRDSPTARSTRSPASVWPSTSAPSGSGSTPARCTTCSSRAAGC